MSETYRTQLESILSGMASDINIMAINSVRKLSDWGQLKRIAESGNAAKYFSPGDVFYGKFTDDTPATPVEYDVPWVVTHIGDVTDPLGVVHSDAIWLMWMYATPQTIQFDAPEAVPETESTFQSGYYYYTKSGSDYVEQTVTPGATIPSGTTYYRYNATGAAARLRYGNNNYELSAIRQWLNSDKAKGAWWSAQHDCDVAPDQANTMSGFMRGLEPEFLDIVKPVQVGYAKPTFDGGETVQLNDRFFLPSLQQMYGSPQVNNAVAYLIIAYLHKSS